VTELADRPGWLWAIPATLILPATHNAIFALRFGVDRLVAVTEHADGVRLPLGDVSVLVQSVLFVPAGAIASLSLLYRLRAARSSRTRATTLAGYVAGLPFAVLGSLMLPLFMDPWIGATLGGARPWLLFTWLGHRAGRYAP
jgi:hypothetical protein